MKINEKRLLNRFFTYVACDSESGNEAAFCALIEEELRGLGLRVERDNAGAACGSNGWNVYAFLEGEGEPILFSAHMDTVSPGVGVKPRVEDGVIRSDGSTILGADDKSGIAAVVEALECVVEGKLRHRPVEVLFTICEELGLLGSKNADYGKLRSREAVVLDSSMADSVINRAPANAHIHFEIQGKSAHAGVSPQEGIHALKAAADAISNIPVGFVDDLSVMNVANLLAPGKTNVVPDKAAFDMEIRSFDEAVQQTHIDRAVAAVQAACDTYGASFTHEVERNAGALYVPEDVPVVRAVLEKFKALGVDAQPDKTYGGSDATWLFANGIDAVNIGTGMTAVHGTGEHIAVADLERTARLVLSMMERS